MFSILGSFLLQFKWVSWLWKNRKVVGIAILSILFVLSIIYVKTLQENNAKLKTEVSSLEGVLKSERKTHKAIVDALERKAIDAQERSEFAVGAAKEIEKGRKNGDGSLAPVLRDNYERLRSRYQERYSN